MYRCWGFFNLGMPSWNEDCRKDIENEIGGLTRRFYYLRMHFDSVSDNYNISVFCCQDEKGELEDALLWFMYYLLDKPYTAMGMLYCCDPQAPGMSDNMYTWILSQSCAGVMKRGDPFFSPLSEHELDYLSDW